MHGSGIAYLILIMMTVIAAIGSLLLYALHTIFDGKPKSTLKYLTIYFFSVFFLEYAWLWIN